MMISSDYSSMYASATIGPFRSTILDYICRVILNNENTYKLVEIATGVPWFCVGAIHFRESDQNFKTHLLNGDPLTARTVHVPAGRPLSGQPPFTWQAAAIDALTGRWMPQNWDIAGCLEFMERYNGLGYQMRSVNSPYIWDFTDKYTGGLFQSDGSFSPSVKENRAGCAAILKTLTPQISLLQ